MGLVIVVAKIKPTNKRKMIMKRPNKINESTPGVNRRERGVIKASRRKL